MNTKKLKTDNIGYEKSISESFSEDHQIKKQFLTFEEIVKERETRPSTKYIYSGIKKGSFGVVFGPSKSGKTIYCENLAICLAIGKKSFLKYGLDCNPKRVLFVSLEEYWVDRVDRNKSQSQVLSDAEVELLNKNYLYQKISFSKYIIDDKEWDELHSLIVSSKAEIVIIDSLTRMNPGELEKTRDAEKVIKKLRDLSQEIGITLFVVHHARKNMDQRLTMDTMKGSSIITQETDFAIGISKTSKNDRYIKNIYYRYAKDDGDTVNLFTISNNTWIEIQAELDEDVLLSKADRRVDPSKYNYLLDYIDSNPNTTFTTRELIEHFTSTTKRSTRTINSHLKAVENLGLVEKPQKGNYRSIKSTSDEEE